MPKLEGLIRPFQDPGLINNQAPIITIDTKVPAKIPTLFWGDAGSGPKTYQYSNTQHLKWPPHEVRVHEVRRVVRDVKVMNPDDPSQYVIEQRPVAFQFTDGSSTQVDQQQPAVSSSGMYGERLNDVPVGNQEDQGGDYGGGGDVDDLKQPKWYLYQPPPAPHEEIASNEYLVSNPDAA